MKHMLKIYHNSYFLNEKEVSRSGPYTNFEEATEKAKEIIKESMLRFLKSGRKANDLFTMWSIYGENPVICTHPEDKAAEGFNASDCASALAEELAMKLRQRA
jgi:hypothetical protein